MLMRRLFREIFNNEYYGINKTDNRKKIGFRAVLPRYVQLVLNLLSKTSVSPPTTPALKVNHFNQKFWAQ